MEMEMLPSSYHTNRLKIEDLVDRQTPPKGLSPKERYLISSPTRLILLLLYSLIPNSTDSTTSIICQERRGLLHWRTTPPR